MKKLAVLLSFFMLFSLVACANSEESSNDESTKEQTTKVTTAEKAETKVKTTTKEKEETTEKEPENPFAKHMTVTYLTRFCENYEEGRWDELELEDKFNIDLKVWNIDCYNAEEVAMMVAAGDWADTGYVNRYDPVRAYEEGLTRHISLEQIKTMLPEYYKSLEDNPIGFKFNSIPEENDQYYGLSFNYASCNFWYHVNCFRLDWLDNIGYPLDDLTDVKLTYEGLKDAAEETVFFSNTPIEYDEFIDIMRGFTEDDPDGNGQDDTFGSMFALTGPSYGSTWTDLLTSMFGIVGREYTRWLYFDDATGNYVPSYATTGWRDFLVFINEMLQKGYMTYLTDVTGTGDYLGNFYGCLGTGSYGYFPLDCGANMNPEHPDWIRDWVPNCILDEDPGAQFVIVPAILGPEGIGGNRRYVTTPFRDGAWGTWTFGGKVSDEKLERLLAMLRYTHFTDEGFYRYFYGIEGVHFKWAGEPYNSAIIKTSMDKIPKKYTSGAIQGIFATGAFLKNFKKWSMKSEFLYQLSDFQVKNNWFVNYTIDPDKFIGRLYMGNDIYDEYVDLRKEINSDIFTVANDFRNKAFKGELADINAEWSTYIDTLYNAGLDQYVEIFNRDEFEKFSIDKSKLYN